jgi:hypothetical protein
MRSVLSAALCSLVIAQMDKAEAKRSTVVSHAVGVEREAFSLARHEIRAFRRVMLVGDRPNGHGGGQAIYRACAT